MIYYLFVAAIIGLVIGFVIGVFMFKAAPPAGTMTINLNPKDPTKELFEIRFEQDLDYMLDNHYVNFKVVVIDEDPHKKFNVFE